MGMHDFHKIVTGIGLLGTWKSDGVEVSNGVACLSLVDDFAFDEE
jgi:hypothetical protein